jgi:hypothetical protein
MPLDAFPQDITQPAAQATADSSDGSHVGGHSIWFTFTAARTQRLRYTTAGSSFDTMLTLFEGPRNARTLVGWDDDGGPGNTSAERSPIVRGHRYWIAVSSARGPAGKVRLTVGSKPLPTYAVTVDGATAGGASGRLSVDATVTCSGPADLWLYAGVSERVGDAVARGSTSVWVEDCGAVPTTITFVLDTETGWAFQTGEAVLFSSAEAWDGIRTTYPTFDSGPFSIVEDPGARRAQ